MTNPSGEFSPLLTATQACERLNVKPRKLYNLTKTGALTCIRLGGSIRYDVADIEALIAKCKEVRGV